MAFEVLSAEGADDRRWSDLIHALPAGRRDIHFLPEYGRIYRDSYGFDPCLAVYSDADGFVIQPFVRRPLKTLLFLEGATDAASFWDIANAYGFGGPVSNIDDPARCRQLYSRFDEAFSVWCEAEQIASEFAVLHPFLAGHQRMLIGDSVALRHEKDVVFIDLSEGEPGIVSGINRGHRSSISKARRAGLRVEKVEPNADNLALFDELYRATMTRRQAASRWLVPDCHFGRHVEHLGPQRVSLFFAYVGDAVESAFFVIGDFETAYYHFAGSRLNFPELRAANLTMLETALWAQKAGYRRYHLGGGVSSRSDDSLLRFKAGFSERRAPLYTYFRIRNKAVYDELSKRKRAYEVATLGAESKSDFVPVYRR
jgi:hypothetical protein